MSTAPQCGNYSLAGPLLCPPGQKTAWTAFKALVGLSGPQAAVVVAGWEITEATFQQFWNQTDGSLTERLTQVKQAIFDRADTGAGESQGVGEGGNV